ncbi:hypothetical protein [Pseudoalteromonas tunicata]|jgi:hypothetical protein|uniref:Solute-binding protein family 3/N-terminal domain-containing protein n=1 Tax=Pseudoalteromonas tunicata D2 TaxID=87626 RepID=A4CCT1_9GAMM|nr:hypothetical protein [Pseudoalteromonas tunicata]ATC93878.1 hypothetical protein PTUN_a1216 [Pseudoalteromonas tunicata]AXT29683.1 hypothetical protein D1819_01840 [Pseudoalteromonas tunicata]EAR27374.1 hypothetical protein PTD2_15082 [Pseudoalteromonas tunicata D2]
MIRYLILLSFVLLSTPVFAKKLPYIAQITIETDIYNYSQDFINGRPLLEITDYQGKNAQRDVVEFILIQQALLLGGLEIEFDFKQGNYDARNLRLLEKGLLLLSFDSMWLTQAQKIEQQVYISDPLIEKGEYVAGIFTGVNNLDAQKIASLGHLHQHSVVSSKDWIVDWQTLEQLQPKKLLHESDWISMAKMVSRGWVDVMLIPFNAEFPFVYQGEGYQLTVVPNVKVALNDSRHFLVSKQHPLGLEVYQALQKGLKILKARGQIRKAYQDAGFINPLVTRWQEISR